MRGGARGAAERKQGRREVLHPTGVPAAGSLFRDNLYFHLGLRAVKGVDFQREAGKAMVELRCGEWALFIFFFSDVFARRFFLDR